MILGSLDYIPLSIINFFRHFYYLFDFFNLEKLSFINNIYNEDKFIIYGYSCRSLFHTLIELYSDNNRNIKILTTPIHHKSFRNIIELFVKKENITILKLNDNYNRIEIDEQNLGEKYDLCIITHLFGQDLNVEELNKIKKNNPKCIFIEDRVQGGFFSRIYSNKLFDISLYSTGMDKKPCGLGGGIIFLKDITLYMNLKEKIDNYKNETKLNRLLFLLKKIPTYLLYNSKICIYFILEFFKRYKLNLYNFATLYRKKNPGFQHDDYNYNPSNSLIKSIDYSICNVDKIEILYSKKSEIYIKEMKKRNLIKYIKWYKCEKLKSVYNTIYCPNKNIINYFNNLYVPIIENPTYKLFNFEYPNKDEDIKFNESLYYLPSIMNLNENEIKELVSILEKFNSNS